MNAIRSALVSPRFSRLLFWLGVGVLAGGLAFLIVKLSDRGGSSQAVPAKSQQASGGPSKSSGAAAQKETAKTYAQIDSGAKRAIREFILYAVTTKDLGRAWRYVAPSLRAGYTFKSWSHANAVPFQPFPVYQFEKSNFAVTSATKNYILVEVALTPQPKAHMRVTPFWIGLKKFGTGARSRWLVDYWNSRWTPPIQANPLND